jgi:hypothetical protein
MAVVQHPGSLLPLWDIIDSVIVSTHGCMFKGFKLRGIDSEHVPSNVLLQSATSLYHDFAKALPEDTYLQIVLDSHNDYSDFWQAFEASPAPDHPVLALQRRRRLDFLKGANLRRHSVYLFFGYTKGFSSKEFRQVTENTHKARLALLEELEPKVLSLLEGAGVSARALKENELVELFWRLLNPGQILPEYCREVDKLPKELLRHYRKLRVHTIREFLMRAEMEWDRHHIKVGDLFYKVLTLRDLPPETVFAQAERYYDLDFDFRLSAFTVIPGQIRQRAALDQQRRFAKADSGRGGNIEDYDRSNKMREGEELAQLLSETGQRLVLHGTQVAISAPSPKELRRRTREFVDAMRGRQIGFYEENAAHDREFFKVFPGMAVGSTRHLLMTSNNAVDCLPLFEEDHGDREPVLLVETDRGELFSFNPFEEARDNWNATIFGASGSGKSVFVNMLIATAVLASRSRGRLICVDFAGEQKSSYLMIARLFGGQFVPILSKDGRNALNPFPPKDKALDEHGQLDQSTMAFLTTLTDLLLSNTGEDKDAALFRVIIQRAFLDTYKRVDGAPIYSDILETLRQYAGQKDIDQARLAVMVNLLDGFLRSPSAKLFNQRSSLSVDSDFLVIDLFGVDTLEPHIAQAVTYLTTQWVKQIAFDARNPGNKYIVLDEVAQLIKRPEMVGLVDELYSTARKHRASVWTVTQSYSTYRNSLLANTVKLNSTTQIFLSHASDEQGRELVAQDYDFNKREKFLFDGLKTVKGQYSSALVRTEVASEDVKKGKAYITTVLRIRLSPFDYQVCTSDARDREIQRKFIEANPGKPLHEIIEWIAYERKNA